MQNPTSAGHLSPSIPDRLAIFTWLLAFANLAHSTVYPGWIQGDDPMGVPIAVAAVLSLLRPGSIALFLTLVTLRVAYCAVHLPFLHNHILLEGFVCLGILIAVVPTLIRQRRLGNYSGDERDQMFASFAGFVRVALLLLYGATFLHKLNVDFFDLKIGCGAHFLVWAAERYPFLPTAEWARACAGIIAVAVEGGIPVLLLFRRTRATGISISLAFHAALGLHPLGIYTFSSTVVAMLFCWTSPDLPAAAAGAYRRFRARIAPISGRSLALGGAGFTLALAIVFVSWKGDTFQRGLYSFGLALWCSGTLVISAFYVGALLDGRMSEPATSTLLRGIDPALWVLFAILLGNVASPYIGLKTRTSLTMYSNLRTEGPAWNHLLLPASMKIFDYQDDLVEVRDTNLPEMLAMRDAEQVLPFFEFRRWSREEPRDFFVVYERGGETVRFEKRNGEGSDAAMMETPFWPLERLLYFSLTDAGPRQSCRHDSPRRTTIRAADANVPEIEQSSRE